MGPVDTPLTVSLYPSARGYSFGSRRLAACACVRRAAARFMPSRRGSPDPAAKPSCAASDEVWDPLGLLTESIAAWELVDAPESAVSSSADATPCGAGSQPASAALAARWLAASGTAAFRSVGTQTRSPRGRADASVQCCLGERAPPPLPASQLEPRFRHAYAVWAPRSVAGVHAGGERAWAALLPYLGGSYDYRRGHRLRRFESAELAVAGFAREARAHSLSADPSVTYW